MSASAAVAFSHSILEENLAVYLSKTISKTLRSMANINCFFENSFKDKSWKSSENQTLAGAPTDGLKRFAVSLVLTGDMMMMKK